VEGAEEEGRGGRLGKLEFCFLSRKRENGGETRSGREEWERRQRKLQVILPRGQAGPSFSRENGGGEKGKEGKGERERTGVFAAHIPSTRSSSSVPLPFGRSSFAVDGVAPVNCNAGALGISSKGSIVAGESAKKGAEEVGGEAEMGPPKVERVADSAGVEGRVRRSLVGEAA
jgi:hypothetical protein